MTKQLVCEKELANYFEGLPEVTDEMFEDVIRLTEHHVMSFGERQEQLVSFVWGNALESDRGTREKVCEHLHVPLPQLG